MKKPDPNTVYPISGYDKEIYIKPTIHNPNIIVGNFSYIADADFESHVTHHYDFIGDKLIIGKFCQIASGVEFVMNGANHQLNAVTTFPFYTLEGWDMEPPVKKDLPLKGDTVICNDVWIGQNATILPGVHIGDGAIIGANSVVGSDVAPYTVVAGNPARVIRKRFDDELIDLLLRFKWWDQGVDEINTLIPLLTCGDLEKVRTELKSQVAVVFEPERSRSAAYVDGNDVGECKFSISDDKWIITHTGVDPAYGGRGIAKKLVMKVIEEARIEQVRIVPVCSYAKKIMESREEYRDVLEKTE